MSAAKAGGLTLLATEGTVSVQKDATLRTIVVMMKTWMARAHGDESGDGAATKL